MRDEDVEKAFDLREMGDLPGAIQLFEEKLSEEGESHQILRGLASFHFEMGNYPCAISCARRAIRLNPESWMSSNVLFLSLIKTGDLQEAIEEGLRFVAIYEGDSTLLDKRAVDLKNDIVAYIATVREVVLLSHKGS